MFKDYELSEAVEEILHEKSVTSGEGWERLYEETSARLTFHINDTEYNDAEISKLTLDKDAAIRAQAGKEIARVYKENAPLFTLNYNMVVKDKAIEDLKRGFSSPVASQNLANRVDDAAVTALAQTVRDHYADIAHRFYKLKAKWLGVSKLEYWDRNAPLPFESERTYSWDEAVKIVLQAYKEFSPKLYRLATDFFNPQHSWIDVPPRDGKRSGAFAMPLPDKFHPYLFLNFVGKQNDVLTLAHELGHGCHMRLSSKQGDLNDSTPLTLAEVASVFAEMLTFQSLLRQAKDDKERLCLIAGKVNDMINTAVRQIAFHFFETRVHDERRNGEVSQDRLAQIWKEEMIASLGDYVNIDEVTENNWAMVGHFFWKPFYVYAYSFADCLVNSLYQVNQKGDVPNFADKYLDMLALTGVKRYDELLKPFGLDANDPHFWNIGLNLISGYIDELEKLDKKLFS
jgi:oligoendopeptidase F